MLALQAQLDAACNKLDAELEKDAPRENVVAAFQDRVKELSAELKMHMMPAGQVIVVDHLHLPGFRLFILRGKHLYGTP